MQLIGGLGARLHRAVARGLEVADHLRRAGARLGQAGRLPAQHGDGVARLAAWLAQERGLQLQREPQLASAAE